MTGPGSDQVRALCFGDVDGTVWGAALTAGSPGWAGLFLGDRTGAGVHLALAPEGWSTDGATWRLAGDGVELEAAPATDERDPIAQQSAVQELCRIRGAVSLDGAERRIDCMGTRAVAEGIRAGSVDSVRAVTGWFAPDEAFTLLALRPPRSQGQEADLVAATLFDPDGWLPVSDPRLSTTYDGAGVPTRVNLELWVGEGENEYPRRASGEASAAGATVTAPGITLRAVPLRCHSRGHDGGGVYVLAGL